MRLRVPLYAKILLWFFLNLICLGAAFYALFRMQFRLGLDSLLAGRAGERIQALSAVIASEFQHAPRTDWSSVLQRFGEAYQVQLGLFGPEGAQLAGDALELPPDVRLRLLGRWGQPAPPFRRGGPPQLPEARRAGRPGRYGAGGPPETPPIQQGPFPKAIVKTTAPVRYWVLVRVPLGETERPRQLPGTLVAMSPTLWGGGLFFDYVPWLAVGLGVLLFSLLFWFPLVRGITRAISQMTTATGQIAEGRFEARAASRRSDELGALAQAINRMAARLAGFVRGQKRFLGDIAHELSSPLARMEVALGILEQRADEKQMPYVEDVREEARHMSSLVNELLSFSRAGLRQQEIRLQPVNLLALAGRVVAREDAEGRRVEIRIDERLQVMAEPELLARALANLVRNAVRYAGQAGPITLSAIAQSGQIAISVADCGPGVPAEELEQIFDPFFRLETSRSRETGGAGLGLAIVKTCVEACRGQVSARNRQPSGLQVDITLAEAAPAGAGQ